MEDEPNTVKNANSPPKNKPHQFFLSVLPYIGGLAGLIAIISVVHSMTQWEDDLEQRLKNIEKSDVATATTSTQQQIQVLNRDILSRLSELEERVKFIENNKNAAINSPAPPSILPARNSSGTTPKCNSSDQQNILKVCFPPCTTSADTISCTATITNSEGDKTLHFENYNNKKSVIAYIQTSNSRVYNTSNVYIGDIEKYEMPVPSNLPISVEYKFQKSAFLNESHINRIEIYIWFTVLSNVPNDYPISIHVDDIEIER